MRNIWGAPLIIQQVDGPALTNTTTATSLLPTQAKVNLAPNTDLNSGIKLKVFAGGRMSSAAATPGTLTLDLRFGSVVVFNGGASGTLATSASNLSWWLELDLIVRTIATGVNSNVIGIGRLLSAALSATTPIMLLPTSSPAVGTSFDNSLSNNTVDLFATWSVASASNSIRCDMFGWALEN